MKKTTLLVCAAAMTASSLAGAASFDFVKGSGGYHDSLNFVASDGVLGVNVTPVNGSKVSWTTQGLGRGTNGFNYLMAGGEGLTFNFTSAVDIGQVNMESYGSSNVSWTDANGLTGSIGSVQGKTGGQLNTITLSNITSMTFTANNNYSMIAGFDDVFATSQVPVPAAAWLFGSALIGLAGIAKKRR
ncbi:hypothetical protein SIN8267_00097 [Sinobacterium norvegicum]|uniref:VPLPA-CTERM sorting domain-containing protein n=1 Tax=Sinobacterium norvegicum TaxID=1641715 RepID=A0ABM9A9T3_9GAMM|nr:VPLPA-CTERM sorting domain-containing protein [Sinobacterium norvegicum]CAH0990015.1 hypothetical protein SIN8267_00097 [Sinobacterium norvegicum]